jgi:hypothetical protein
LHFEQRDADNSVCVILAILSLTPGFSRVYLLQQCSNRFSGFYTAVNR